MKFSQAIVALFAAGAIALPSPPISGDTAMDKRALGDTAMNKRVPALGDTAMDKRALGDTAMDKKRALGDTAMDKRAFGDTAMQWTRYKFMSNTEQL
ncbi:hypothetical protein GE09DRAFT_510165 [Coniochaeta sp. 2T2.1]|nr:hypothetical protein GE09DRAFT_510165 [Coniochaeta sp. 2T2.1]